MGVEAAFNGFICSRAFLKMSILFFCPGVDVDTTKDNKNKLTFIIKMENPY